MTEYDPDPIVIRAAVQRAERLSDEEYVRQLEDEIRERNEAVEWYGPTVASYRPDLLIGALRAAPSHRTWTVYGLLLQLSEIEPRLASDGLVRAMARKYMIQFENGVILDHQRSSLLRPCSADYGTLLKPAHGFGTVEADKLLRAGGDVDE